MSELTAVVKSRASDLLKSAVVGTPEDALAILALVAIAEGLEELARAVAAGAVLAAKGKP